MKQKFGVIAKEKDSNYIILYEGDKDKLDSMINIIKSCKGNDKAKIIYLDKEEYNTSKYNIKDLNKLLKDSESNE